MDAMAGWAGVVLGRLALAVLQSLPLAALVWMLCRWLPRLGAARRCWLWWLVSLQLLAGLVWPAPVMLHWLPAPAAAEPAVAMPALPPMPADALSLPPASAPVAAAGTAWSGLVPLVLLSIWAVGVLWMAWRSLRDWRAVRRRIAEASPLVPGPVQQRCRELARRLRVAPPALRLSGAIDSPQLVGVLEPHLLLPARMLPLLPDDAIDMALRHELAHLQRRDLLWGWWPALAQHLFFFHPVAHLAAREYALAREAACDAAVLADPRVAPQDYGRLLLQFGVAPRAVAVAGAASPDFVALKRRLVMLQSHVPAWRVAGPLLVAVVGALGVMPYRVVAQPELDPAQRANQAASSRPAASPAPAPAAAIAAPAPAPEPAALPRPPAPPAAPTAPEAPPMPEPPAPPKPPRPDAGMSLIELDDGRALAWVLIEDGHTHAVGQSPDVAAARRLREGNAPVWWFRQGDARYVVRDPGTIARLKRAYEPVTALGRQQGELGRQQGALGGKQGELGAQIAALAARQAQLATGGGRDAAGQEALSSRIEALAERQRTLGEQQRELGDRQSAIGERQKAAVEGLLDEANRLAAETVRNGTAQRL
ncbi:M56 family metallopeptidase [[Pseudomonas] boreopolis]|uniref:M56 family metallopeptidase n=1 Tax=Xanthomonas boreopolis TaxID=86183 RepID=UPI003D568CE0